MNYLQIGVLVVLGFIALAIWWYCLVDLNKDVTYHNRKGRRPRPTRRVASSNVKSRTSKPPSTRAQVSPFPKNKGGRRG